VQWTPTGDEPKDRWMDGWKGVLHIRERQIDSQRVYLLL